MNFPRLVLLAVMLSLCACSTNAPLIGDYSPQAAKRQAQRDFAAGRPVIYKAGGYAAFEPGIADNERALVAKLPRNGSLCGCTNPHVEYSQGYATAYNREIIHLLKQKNPR